MQGPPTSSISSTWELGRKADLWAPPQGLRNQKYPAIVARAGV